VGFLFLFIFETFSSFQRIVKYFAAITAIAHARVPKKSACAVLLCCGTLNGHRIGGK
jgi:hypothetical protein